MPWADKNFAQAEEQILVKEATARPSIATVAAEGDKPEVMMTKASDIITIKGNGYTAQFDIKTGTIYSLTYGNEKVITDGNGPQWMRSVLSPITITGSILSGLIMVCTT